MKARVSAREAYAAIKRTPAKYPYSVKFVNGEEVILKVAWIRNDEPAGHPAPGKFNCPCGNSPETMFVPGPDIICNCGQRYSWDGAIKGDGFDNTTGYEIVMETGDIRTVNMAADITLGEAYHYFDGKIIDGLKVVDVRPYRRSQ